MSAWIFVSLMLTAAVSDESAVRPSNDPAALGSSSGAATGTGADAVLKEAAPRSPKELRGAVHIALRAAATQSGAARQAAIRRLAAIYVELSRDTQLPVEERLILGRTVRGRLIKIKDQIKGHNRSEQPLLADRKPLGPPMSSRDNSQHAPADSKGFLGGAAGPPDDGEALVDLIQRTIAPGTWDINGGLGTIRYFSPLHAIVVRQTDEVHDSLIDVLKALHD